MVTINALPVLMYLVAFGSKWYSDIVIEEKKLGRLSVNLESVTFSLGGPNFHNRTE
jgi:hypothetical protein